MLRSTALVKYSRILLYSVHCASTSMSDPNLFPSSESPQQEGNIKKRKKSKYSVLGRNKSPSESKECDQFGTTRSPDLEQTIRVKNYLKWSKSHLNIEGSSKDFYNEENETEFIPLVINKQHPDWYVDQCLKLAGKGKLAECVAMLETRMLKEDRVTPSIRNFNVVLKPLSHVGQLKTALRVHRLSEEYGIKSSMASYTCLLTACANTKDKPLAMQVLDEVKKALFNRDRTLQTTHYNVIINTYAKHGELAKALQTADEMKNYGRNPNNYTFGHLLESCVNSPGDGMSLALKVWQDMLAANIKPTISNFTSLLTVCRKCDFGDENLQKLEETAFNPKAIINCESADVSSNTSIVPVVSGGQSELSVRESTSAGLVDARYLNKISKTSFLCHRVPLPPPPPCPTKPCDRLHYLGGVQSILAALKFFNLKPNFTIISACLHVLPNNAESERILLGGLQHLKIELDVQVFNQIIARRAKRFAYREAREVLEMIRFCHLSPDIYSFGPLAMCCTKGKHVQELFQDMQACSVKPNAHVMLPVLKWTINNQKFTFASHLLSKCRRLKIPISKKFVKDIDQAVKNMKGQSSIPSPEEQEFLENYDRWLKGTYFEETNDPELQFHMELKNLDTDVLRTNDEKPWLTKSNIKYE